ncbi:hypothetical protein AV530_003481 [Patagioenas fasciata monilis]|uniref:Uncharacterized protein n=1 Tax=Patagioenas fasciata monilis TaxID=372326 RepID=A0A1V4K2X0_PATFA|nr:hypothetical protein AV530_003481 [Patagioenas fasciata monilis]
MSGPAPQYTAWSLSSLPKRTLPSTSRTIRYVFLDGCKNIPASYTMDGAGSAHKVYKGFVSSHPKAKHPPNTAAERCPPLPKYFPTFFTFPMHLEKQAMGSGHVLASKKRLPVFRQLCGEAVPTTALGDVHLQNSSQELEELPDAKAPREDTKGRRMRQEAGCSPCNEA